MGTRQTGLPDLRIANILRDREILELARGEALDIVAGMDAAEAEGRSGPHGALVQHALRRWGERLGFAATG